jgi:hypothetical protein
MKQILLLTSTLLLLSASCRKYKTENPVDVKSFIRLLITLFLFNAFSCHKKSTCESPLEIKTHSEIVVTFKDKATGKYLYSEVNPLYNKDSLKVFDQYGNGLVILSLLRSAPDNANQGIYVLSFGNIYDDRTDANAFNAETCKTYIIKYSYNEADTVQACFKAKKTECGSVFETLKVYNKGQLLADVQNDISAKITITKN